VAIHLPICKRTTGTPQVLDFGRPTATVVCFGGSDTDCYLSEGLRSDMPKGAIECTKQSHRRMTNADVNATAKLPVRRRLRAIERSNSDHAACALRSRGTGIGVEIASASPFVYRPGSFIPLAPFEFCNLLVGGCRESAEA